MERHPLLPRRVIADLGVTGPWEGGPVKARWKDMADSRLGRVLIAWDTAVGVLVGALTVWLIGPQPLAAVALAILGGAIALVAVLATIVTLLAVLLNADAMAPLVERLGGRDDVMFPFWFHGYLSAATIVAALLAAVGPAPLSRWFTGAAAGMISWAAVAMIDLAREAMELGAHRRTLEGAAERFRNRHRSA